MNESGIVKGTEPDKAYGSPIGKAIIMIAVFFLCTAPFNKGLFNGGTVSMEFPLLLYYALSFILLFLVSIHFFRVLRWDDRRDPLILLVWLLPLSYVISAFFAASPSLARDSVLLHIMYAVFFIIGAYWARENPSSQILQWSLLASGYLIVIFGYLNLFGNVHYEDALKVEGTTFRISSVFQYPNSYAALLLGIGISCAWMLVSTKSKAAMYMSGFMLVPVLLSFFMTLSRGGLLFFPIVVLFTLPLMSLSKQILFIVHILIGLAASAALTGEMTGIGFALYRQFSAGQSLQGWLILLGTSAAVMVLCAIIQHYAEPKLTSWVERRLRVRYASLWLPALTILIGIVSIVLLFGDTGFTKLLPDTLSKRIDSINFHQHSFLERATFYQDGIKLLRDYPWFGAGGGGWAALYETYQNNPYVSRQTHNYYLQLLVEVGMIGFAVFMLFFVVVTILYVKSSFSGLQRLQGRGLVFYIMAVSLLLHSVMDFNMSYAYLAAVMFLSLGGMAAGTSVNKEAGNIVMPRGNWRGKAVAICFGLLSIALYASSLQSLYANYLYRHAMDAVAEGQPVAKALAPLDGALAIRPNHPDYVLLKARLLSKAYTQSGNIQQLDEAEVFLRNLRDHEPYNRQALEVEYEQYISTGKKEKALDLVRFGLKHYPWDIHMVERAVILQFELGNEARQKKQIQKARAYWKGALSAYESAKAGTEELKKLVKGQRQGRAFDLTSEMNAVVAQIHYFTGDYAAASSLLQPEVKMEMSDPFNRMVAFWYIAALQKQGKTDAKLLVLLNRADSGIKEKYQYLRGLPPL